MGSRETRRDFLKSTLLATAPLMVGPAAHATASAAELQSKTPAGSDREKWLAIVERVSQPVLEAISQQKLRATMPVEAAAGLVEARSKSTHLEAVGRLLSGLAPWLDAEPSGDAAEEALRKRYREWARLAIRYGTDAHSPDALNFGTNHQSLVDAALLALAVLRAPNQLWGKLDKPTQENLVRSLTATRKLQPGLNNWVLFSATIEAFFCKFGQQWDATPIDFALRKLQEWYKGDGMYGDGPWFHWDYYNSFVIQPMMLNILDAVRPVTDRWETLRKPVEARAQRYAAIEERLISPEGTFPPIGRSLAYRFGALHHLAEMALRRDLPEGVHPAQVRCAMTAVMTRMIAAEGTFDSKGWLTIGFAGHQPAIGDGYISTGSCYLCAAAWLPLGLPVTDEFWSAPAEPWTAQKAWGGVNIKADHAIRDSV
ncbi:conserved exported hypothetical protein [Candidatus Sulfotelmatomonas gaucii]|uniref:DUF2264 domain-containing protein n=1 Tax=Candidatus Sulfuritelmatomonas gaucii TaxID=2043161 RepID=A0A2N9LHW2_9BACT|nr:conserved exported hypothetical protein [Candidatus Sulfotelmatomonas gaucii]